MTRIMYDAVTPTNLPGGADLYAGYVDGRYANVDRIRARFPTALVVAIAVFASTNGGVVLDVELGDATPSEAPGWVHMRRAAGVDPTVYVSASAWPTVRGAFESAGEPEPHWWIAHYDGIAEIPAGAVAKQFRNGPAFDTSIVADHWPGIDPGGDMTPEEFFTAVGWPRNLDGTPYTIVELLDERDGRVGDNVNAHAGQVVNTVADMLGYQHPVADQPAWPVHPNAPTAAAAAPSS